MRYALLFVAFAFCSNLALLGQNPLHCPINYANLSSNQAPSVVWEMDETNPLTLDYTFNSNVSNFYTEIFFVNNDTSLLALDKAILGHIDYGMPLDTHALIFNACEDLLALPVSYNKSILDSLFLYGLSNTTCCLRLDSLYPQSCTILTDLYRQYGQNGFYSIMDLAPLFLKITGEQTLSLNTINHAITILNQYWQDYPSCTAAAAANFCITIDTLSIVEIIVPGGQVIDFEVFPYYTVWYPMTVNSYAMPPFYSIDYDRTRALCPQDFLYINVDNDPNLIFLNEKGDFLIQDLGDYAVEVCHKYNTALPCRNMIITAVDTFQTPIEAIEMANAWRIHPNPTQNQIQLTPIAAMGELPYHISVADVSGRVLFRTSFMPSSTNASYELNMEHLAAGMYLLSVENDKAVHTEKILKY